MNLNNEVQIFKQIATQGQYTLGSAIADLTGVGTLYSIGSDYARELRLSKMEVATKNIPLLNTMVKEYLDSTKLSIVSKIAYLSGVTCSAIGYYTGIDLLKNTGLISTFVIGAGFFARAGFNASEQIQDDCRLAAAAISSKEKTV